MIVALIALDGARFAVLKLGIRTVAYILYALDVGGNDEVAVFTAFGLFQFTIGAYVRAYKGVVGLALGSTRSAITVESIAAGANVFTVDRDHRCVAVQMALRYRRFIQTPVKVAMEFLDGTHGVCGVAGGRTRFPNFQT